VVSAPFFPNRRVYLPRYFPVSKRIVLGDPFDFWRGQTTFSPGWVFAICAVHDLVTPGHEQEGANALDAICEYDAPSWLIADPSLVVMRRSQ
jgi:hypothetical protein